MVLWRPTNAPSHDPMYTLHLIMTVNDCMEKQQSPIDLDIAGACLVQGAYDEDAMEGPKAILLVPGGISEYAAPEGGIFIFTNPFVSGPTDDNLPPLKIIVLK